MKLTHVSIDDIEVSEHNPRKVKPDEMRKLMQSIKRDEKFLEARPILVNHQPDGRMVIYAGTQRYLACIELGWLKVPVHIEKNLSSEIMHERMLRDNHNNGQWDDKLLLDNFDISLLTFFDLNEKKGNFKDVIASVEEVDLNKADFVKTDVGEKPKAKKTNYNFTFTDAKQKKKAQSLIDEVRGEYNFEVALINKIVDMGIFTENGTANS